MNGEEQTRINGGSQFIESIETKVDSEQEAPEFHAEKPTKSLREPTTQTDDTERTRSAASNLIINLLSTVIATEHSVRSCSASIQKRFADDPELLNFCVQVISEFFLSVDNSTRKTVFYILNDLVQYDLRFRLPVLREVLPKIGLTISMISDKEIYLKTVAVWEDRKIYPPEVCRVIFGLFGLYQNLESNTMEYEQRISSLTDMLRIRSVKDAELQKICGGSAANNLRLSTNSSTLDSAADKDMGLSTTELKNRAVMTRALSVITQGIIQYVNRLLLDCNIRYNSHNVQSIKHISNIIKITKP